MGLDELYAIKDEMEKAEARKLQPYFIRAFFTEAFKTLGGEMRNREAGRFEIRHVPAAIRERDRVIGETRTPVLKNTSESALKNSTFVNKANPWLTYCILAIPWCTPPRIWCWRLTAANSSKALYWLTRMMTGSNPESSL